MNHAAFYVANNSVSKEKQDKGATGDLVNAHTRNRYRTIWNMDRLTSNNKSMRVYAFELKD